MSINHSNVTDNTWSRGKKLIFGLLLVAWCSIVLMGPATNPIATEELTAPVGRAIRPIHDCFFIGHGYRFFAPDPGPSHMIVYRVQRDGETVREGRFPDRNKYWPRVIYHRWFMLSETIYNEHASTPDAESFSRIQVEYELQIEQFKRAGQGSNAAHVQKILDRQNKLYEKTPRRIEELVNALGRELLQQFDGDSVELSIQERALQAPVDAMLGYDLDDKRYLSNTIPIGTVVREATDE
ncbi:MAG: hypothetical protein R3C03_05630 [Pirellulaceae bacterium]